MSGGPPCRPGTRPIGCVALLMADQGNRARLPPGWRSVHGLIGARLRCGSMASEADRLRIEELRRALLAPSGPYAALDVVASTGSTNADLMAAAGSGAADRSVLIAEEQTEGRGRRSRDWVSP